MTTVVVIGVGRCGTSRVAGCLHNDLGVFMGHRFVPPNPTNIHGHWEDIEFRDLNQAVLQKVIRPYTWKAAIIRLIASRASPWGFKDPRVCDLLYEYVGLLKNAMWIYCRREPQEIMDSMARAYSQVWTLANVRETYTSRQKMIDNHLGERHEIWPLAPDMTDAKLKRTLKKWLTSYQSA